MHSIQSNLTPETALSRVTFVCVWQQNFSKSVSLQFHLFISPSPSTPWLKTVGRRGVGGGKKPSAGHCVVAQSHPQAEINLMEARTALTSVPLWLIWVRSLTSMTSVWACLVQKACGGVVQLTATKLLGFRSRDGVTRSEHAGWENTHKSSLASEKLEGLFQTVQTDFRCTFQMTLFWLAWH